MMDIPGSLLWHGTEDFLKQHPSIVVIYKRGKKEQIKTIKQKQKHKLSSCYWRIIYTFYISFVLFFVLFYSFVCVSIL